MNNHNSNSKVVITSCWHCTKHLLSFSHCSSPVRRILLFFSCVADVSIQSTERPVTCLASQNLQVIEWDYNTQHSLLFTEAGVEFVVLGSFQLRCMEGGTLPPLLPAPTSGHHSDLLSPHPEAIVCGSLGAGQNEQYQ